MRYRDYTRNTRELLKRIAHRSRLSSAAELVFLSADDQVLDYGCGDGALFDELERRVPAANLCGFDPAFLAEMDRDDVETYEDARALLDSRVGEFDAIFCLEVCEHLTDAALMDLLSNLRRLGRPGARVVFGVPLETGLSGFAKNLYRIAKGGRQGATLVKAVRSLFGRPIARQATSEGWIGSHIGFSAEAFGRLIARSGFRLERRSYLPWPRLGWVLNNEIYFVCRLVAAEAPARVPERLAA